MTETNGKDFTQGGLLLPLLRFALPVLLAAAVVVAGLMYAGAPARTRQTGAVRQLFLDRLSGCVYTQGNLHRPRCVCGGPAGNRQEGHAYGSI